MKQSVTIKHFTRGSSQRELNDICNAINAASWDEANDLETYDPASLKSYLERQETLFLACFSTDSTGPGLAGIASGSIQMKPYQKSLWLYVDEVDVCVNQRQRGIGKIMMQALLEIAAESGCEELWLGTETDNLPALALYRSLDPDEEDSVVGFTWETD